jgi:hypothetical protein
MYVIIVKPRMAEEVEWSYFILLRVFAEYLLPSEVACRGLPKAFCRWRDKGIWEKLLEIIMKEPDYEWLMIDSTHIKVHQHAAGAVGGNQAMSISKGGSIPRYTWPWMRMVCRSELLLQTVPGLIAHRLRNLSGT